MTSAERRESIMKILNERRHESMSYFVKKFEVSRNTIVRDVDKLSMSYPIYTLKGHNGGVFLMDGFRFVKIKLNEDQFKLLVRLHATLSEKDREIMSEILKIVEGG